MDVSALLSAQSAKAKSVEVEKDIPVDIDVGLLTVTDPNPLDEDEYKANRESYLLSNARDGVQLLLASLFALPVQPSPDGPLAKLPPPLTAMPRAKPLPKPKPPTKWERFASAKGIQKKRREKKVWDEEKGDYREVWGRGGKGRELEEQWLVEVPNNAPADFDPVKDARDARKKRVAQNEKAKLGNMATAQRVGANALNPPQEREARKSHLEKNIASSRISTASMGKFDKKLEGEPKLRGTKRKFDPIEKGVESEKASSMAILSKLDREGPSKRAKRSDGENKDDVLNVRKAIRFESRGRGRGRAAPTTRGRGRGGSGRGRGR